MVVAGLALIEDGQGDAVRGYLDNPYSQVEPSAVVLLNRLLR